MDLIEKLENEGDKLKKKFQGRRKIGQHWKKMTFENNRQKRTKIEK